MLGWQTPDHHSHSPHLATCDFHRLSALKGNLRGHHFTCDEDVTRAAITWLRQQGYTLNASGMDKLKSRAVISASTSEETVLKHTAPLTTVLSVSYIQIVLSTNGYFKSIWMGGMRKCIDSSSQEYPVSGRGLKLANLPKTKYKCEPLDDNLSMTRINPLIFTEVGETVC
jgi:hypothetical protein